jgi:phycobilisome core component
MKDIVKSMAADAGVGNTAFLDQPFDHMTRELSEQDI